MIAWKQILKLMVRDQNRCCYCGQLTWHEHHETLNSGSKLTMATREHIKPKSNGGDNSLSNLLLACYECNIARGNISFNEFLDIIHEPIGTPIIHTPCTGVSIPLQQPKERLKQKREKLMALLVIAAKFFPNDIERIRNKLSRHDFKQVTYGIQPRRGDYIEKIRQRVIDNNTKRINGKTCGLTHLEEITSLDQIITVDKKLSAQIYKPMELPKHHTKQIKLTNTNSINTIMNEMDSFMKGIR